MGYKVRHLAPKIAERENKTVITKHVFLVFPLTTRILILKKDAKSLDNCYLEKLSGFCGRAGSEGSLTHVYSPSTPLPQPRQGMQAAVILERGATEDGLESEFLPLQAAATAL